VSVFSVPDFNCPDCGAKLPPRPRQPWICAACSKQFQISQSYRTVFAWCLVGILFGLFHLLGLRGWQLFLATAVTWFPVLGLSIPLLYRVIPPRIQPYQPATIVKWFGLRLSPRSSREATAYESPAPNCRESEHQTHGVPFRGRHGREAERESVFPNRTLENPPPRRSIRI
jgi:DNA-directed RNA polymerase subunit RPC12/RpoP